MQELFALTNKQIDKMKVGTEPIEGSWLDGTGEMVEPLTDEDMLEVNVYASTACFLKANRMDSLWGYDKRLTKPVPACDDTTYALTQNNKDEALILVYNGAQAAAIIKPMHKGMTEKLQELMGAMAETETGETWGKIV